MSPVSVFRLSVWAAIAVLGVFLIASTQLIGSPIAELSTGTAKVGGPFALTSHKGERVDNRSLAGKPYLVFFGFTYCPEICPTTLFELTDLMAELGPDADDFVQHLGQHVDVTHGVEEDARPADDPMHGAVDVLLIRERLVPGGRPAILRTPRPPGDGLDGLHGHVALLGHGDQFLEVGDVLAVHLHGVVVRQQH